MTKKFLFVDPAPKKPLDPKSMQILKTVVTHLQQAHFAANGNTFPADYRRYVLSLMAPGQPGEKVPIAEMASLCGVPLVIFKEWLSSPPAG